MGDLLILDMFSFPPLWAVVRAMCVVVVSTLRREMMGRWAGWAGLDGWAGMVSLVHLPFGVKDKRAQFCGVSLGTDLIEFAACR